MFADPGLPFKVNAYILHEHLQIDFAQVDFYFCKLKSTCSTCSDSNLKSGCDNDSCTAYPLFPGVFFIYFRVSISREINHMPSNHSHVYDQI